MRERLDANKISASTEESEAALIAQAHQYRTEVKENNPVQTKGLPSDSRSALISALLIPFGGFIASISAIIFGHKGVRNTASGTRGHRVAKTCMIIGYVTLSPIALFILANIRR